MWDVVQRFIDEYFTAPLANPGQVAPYNLVNTLGFAFITLLVAYLLWRLMRKLGVETDERFFYSILPFVLLGSTVRAAVDAQMLPREVVFGGVTYYPFVTPMIYAVVTVISLTILGVALWRRGHFHSIMRAGGLGLSLPLLAALAPLSKNYSEFLLIFVLALLGVAASEGLSMLAKKFWAPTQRGTLERITVFSHAFDGAATFVGVTLLGYGEQHVVANALFDIGTPALFLVVKVIFATVAVELLARELRKPEERNQRIYLLLLLTVFGLAPGLRDALRILAGV